MSCPTCDHTMQSLGEIRGTGRVLYHCPRCGTVRLIGHAIVGDDDHVPKLVERCRKFEKAIPGNVVGEMNEWKRLGIAEAINKPEDRPQ